MLWGDLQEVSIRVAARVMERAIEEGVARKPGLKDCNLDTYARQRFCRARHLPFVRGPDQSGK